MASATRIPATPRAGSAGSGGGLPNRAATGIRALCILGLACALVGCAEPAPLVLDLLPATATNRIEAAVHVPPDAQLVLTWRPRRDVDDRRKGYRDDFEEPTAEVWVHREDGSAQLLAAQELALESANRGTVVGLSDYAGEAVLIAAVVRGISPQGVEWTTAELRGTAEDRWFGKPGDPSRWRVVAPEGSPHVFVYVVDALRASALGIAGGRAPTPNIDRLAREGAWFTHAISSSSWTRAGIGSLFTGLYATAHGASDRDSLLAEGAFTLAERFRVLGYRTLGVIANRNVDSVWGFDQGFEAYVSPARPEERPDDATKPKVLNLAGEVHAKALEVLTTSMSSDRPVLLYVHVVDPHAPYDPDPWLLEERKPSLSVTPALLRRINRDGVPPEMLRALTTLYRGEVAYTDMEFGRLHEELSRLLPPERTVTLFTADHGEALGEHDRVGHGLTLYDEEIRVPFVLWGPGRIPGDTELSIPASLVDVIPTVLRLAGHPADGPLMAGVQGTDLSMSWRDGIAPDRRYVGAELELGRRLFRSLRSSRWKLIHNFNRDVSQLYDLRADPAEEDNLARKQQTMHVRMARRLEAWVDSTASVSLPSSDALPAPVDEAVIENLRALGYIE